MNGLNLRDVCCYSVISALMVACVMQISMTKNCAVCGKATVVHRPIIDSLMELFASTDVDVVHFECLDRIGELEHEKQ